MKTLSSAIIATQILLILFGCNGNDYEKTRIKYGMKRYEKKSEKCDSTGCAKIVLEYPAIKSAFNGLVEDSLTNYIQSTLLENYFQGNKVKSLDQMAEIFLDDYENTRTELPVYGIPWEINNTISVTYNTNSIVAFQSEFYHFTGGAHGISGIYFANFDSKDGKKLTLSDLLIAGYKKELDNIAEKIFRKEKELELDENLEAAGYGFEGNQFSLNDNFGIKNDGLIFYFNSYEVAPYAMGSAEIMVPYSEIKNLVKQDGLLNNVIAELN